MLCLNTSPLGVSVINQFVFYDFTEKLQRMLYVGFLFDVNRYFFFCDEGQKILQFPKV